MPRDNIIPLHRSRHVRPVPPEVHREVAGLDAWLRRQRNQPTWWDDVKGLFAEIRASWASHLLVALLGFMVGSFGLIGLAWLTVQVVS